MVTGVLSKPIKIITALATRRVPEKPMLEVSAAVQEPGPLAAAAFLSMFDSAPPMDIDATVSEDQRDKLWANIAGAWSSFGDTDPYWSVLTDERWRIGNMSDVEKLNAFYATGVDDLAKILMSMARSDIEVAPASTCVEYGCGVGRLTTHLAERFERVIAFDVSEPHIAAARKWTAGRGLHNIEFVLVRTPADLPRMQGHDFFVSTIVLQHNPPPIMIDILTAAFSGANPGSSFFVQAPTYARSYAFQADRYLESWSPSMEMHAIAQKDILSLARKYGVFPLEITPDLSVGASDDLASSVFVMRKD